MKLLSFAFCALAIPALAVAQATTSTATTTAKKGDAKSAVKGGARTIEITGTEAMKYDVTAITAKPGEEIRIVLKAVGSMPKVVMAHNFVLLKADASPMEINNAAFAARATDFIPPDMKDKIIAFTPLAGGGETVEITFKAPAKPGAYTYLCTFPGHFAQGMKGTLTVK